MTWKTAARSDFERLREAGAARSGPLTVSWLPTATAHAPVLAFAISKRVGNAVVRNRLRRRLREAARCRAELPAGVYLIRARPGADAVGFEELSDHLRRAVVEVTGPKPIRTKTRLRSVSEQAISEVSQP